METLPAITPLLALAGLLPDPLVVVDVGARWGFSPVWAGLGDRCVSIGFEPDEEEYARLVEQHRGNPSLRFAPVALGSRPGLATLHLTRNRGGCSVYPSSEKAIARHPGLDGGRVEGTTVIEMTTLDDWCEREHVDRVDAVKLDTQGSELDILRGAERTLRTVRVLEVEVEFNKLYEGIPLFGDIDRYLRTQGFVLWKLRDLAHYGTFGAPSDWRTPEACYYDDYTAPYAGGAGQLYWANAFFLREDVAYPDHSVGWGQLVRDACLTTVQRFFDLSAKALDLAVEGAPPEAVPVIEAARQDEQSKRHAHGRATTTLSSTFKLSFADPGFTGGGWLPPQSPELGGVRWSGPGRDAWVDVPVAVLPGTRIEFLAASFITHEIGENLVVEVNGVPIRMSRSPHPKGVLYSGVTPPGYGSPRTFTRIMLRVPHTVAWNEVHPESEDDSELGLAVVWLRLTPPQ